MFFTTKKLLCSLVFASALSISHTSHALYINLSDTGNVAANASFRKAADLWQSIFTDDITVNIVSSFASLGEKTIGQTGSGYINTQYSFMKAALTADAKSDADVIMVGGLPAGDTYSKLMNGTYEATEHHQSQNYKQTDVQHVEMTRANAKAMGLLDARDSNIDAEITFNSAFNFDFDSSDGILEGSIEFFGVALHEIGHTLGFDSGVDVLDFYSFIYNGLYSDLEYAPFTTPLDFTRCSDESKAQGADLDWTAGSTPKHFTIDGNCSTDARLNNAWSTGTFQGDGEQASHWKDNRDAGIMDPTTNFGDSFQVSRYDLLAFDVIGWDLKHQVTPLPEPSGFFLLGLGLAGLCLLNRRKRLAK